MNNTLFNSLNESFYISDSPLETYKASQIQNNEHIKDDEDKDCPKIVFIVPYRDREQQLLFFQRHMKYILEDYDEKDVQTIICHQSDKRSFNCGAMKNIGFHILKQKYPTQYRNITLVFNDVDTLPFNKNFINYETSQGTVKHFYGFKHTLGGIVSIRASDFERINGFPNFWAWGYEDNMFYERAIRSKIEINREQFYPYADKNILHFYDGYVKQVNKKEFDRYARYHSWGSARETFGWDDMKKVRLHLPSVEKQDSIIELGNIVSSYEELIKKYDTMIKKICPIFLKGIN